ncbi:hypothetical protein SBRCBS47491_009658 [Sporothrix bragantina]|uniref:Uncharacterized protein n=1 Tax=Sporothrix bragantina TaxID=671064 RepID=A0ABP0CWP2_9PEZI
MSRQGRRRETIKGSWTDAEDKRLAYIVTTASSLNWSNVADEMQGRSAKQCRERWVQNLRPDLEHEPINEMEGNFIMAHVETLGKKWAEIARRLEYETGRVRSDNNVKNWYNGTVNRQTRAERRREAAGHHRHNINTAAPATLPRPSASFSSSCRSRAARPTPPQQLTLAHQRELPRPMTSASDMAMASPMSANSYYGEHRHHQYPSQHPHPHAAPSHQQYNGPSGYQSASHPAAPYQRRPSVHQLPPLQDALRHNVQDRESDSHWSQQHQQQQPHYQPQQAHYPQRLTDRRASVYTMVDSPRSDHHYVPSLVSDTGSPPSLRESPMHAPVSPNTAVPPILPPLSSMEVEDKDAHGAYRSPTTMTRSWSGHSDDQHLPRPLPPVLMEPKLVAPSPNSSSRGPSSGFALSHLLNR